MIKYVEGDIFDCNVDMRVNTVNCVGVMGKGVALGFKERYPEMFNEYAYKCRKGEVTPGVPFVWRSQDMLQTPVEIINFPTKNHWRNPSEYSYIEGGLIWMRDFLKTAQGKRIAIPALGCGHGGLDWNIVKHMIESYLSSCPAEIFVFEPSSSVNVKKIKLDGEKLRLINQAGVFACGSNSIDYPEVLRRHGNRDLYCYGVNGVHSYDFTILCSSAADINETNLVADLADFIVKSKKSLLLGSSLMEKNLAIKHASSDVSVGCFLPSGIYNSALKLKKKTKGNLGLLSFGDPFENFDRKEYMPAVLARMAISKNVVFTTGKLDWIAKNKKFFESHKANLLFFGQCIDGEGVDLLASVGAKLLLNFDEIFG